MDPVIFSTNLGYLADIFQAISIIMGLGLFMSALFRLKRYAEMRTFMSHQMTLAWPIFMMLGGIMLLTLPFTLRTTLLNTLGTSSPLRYSGPSSGFEQLIPPIILVVRLIGVGAFIRGIVLFSRAGREGIPPGTIGKAMLHVLGGILCIHILGTVNLLKSILGYSVT